MTMEGMDLTPLELNLHKYDLVIISQIIEMIETDVFWHHKTFESVLSNLRNMWMEGIHELENTSMYCTNNTENNDEMDGLEVIDLCSVVRLKTRHVAREKKVQNKKTKTKQNLMQPIEWKMKLGPKRVSP